MGCAHLTGAEVHFTNEYVGSHDAAAAWGGPSQRQSEAVGGGGRVELHLPVAVAVSGCDGDTGSARGGQAREGDDLAGGSRAGNARAGAVAVGSLEDRAVGEQRGDLQPHVRRRRHRAPGQRKCQQKQHH